MSSFVLKYLANRILKDNQWNRLGVEDPYYEEVAIGVKNGKTKYKKVPRRSDGISDNDMKVLETFKKKAYRYDRWFTVFGISFGWTNIVGIIPVAGAIISAYWSLSLLVLARSVEDGLPLDLNLLFLLNIVIDFIIGLIPIIGDLIVIGYKSNSRNYLLLEKHLVRVGEKRMGLIEEKDVKPSFINDKIGPFVEEKVVPQAAKAGENIKAFVNKQLYNPTPTPDTSFGSISSSATIQTSPTTVTTSSNPSKRADSKITHRTTSENGSESTDGVTHNSDAQSVKSMKRLSSNLQNSTKDPHQNDEISSLEHHLVN